MIAALCAALGAAAVALALTRIRLAAPPPNDRRATSPGQHAPRLPTATMIGALDAAARRARAAEPWRELLIGDVHAVAANDADRAVARHAAELAWRVGSHDAAILDSATSTLRARQAIRDEAAAHSAQARLSARILTALPVGVAALNALSERGRAVIGSLPGMVCIACGACLNAAGWLWMRHHIRRVEQW